MLSIYLDGRKYMQLTNKRANIFKSTVDSNIADRIVIFIFVRS